MRRLCAVLAAFVVAGTVSAVASAQGTPPTVTVTASVTAVSAAPAPIAPGATKFNFASTEQRADLQVFIVAPKPGRTTDQVIAALKSNPNSSFEVLDIVASVTLSPGASGRSRPTSRPARATC